MEAFSALLALCEGIPPVTGGFPSQRPVTWSCDVFFDLRLNKRLSKRSRHRWFKTPSRSLWRHCNARLLSNWRAMFYILHAADSDFILGSICCNILQCFCCEHCDFTDQFTDQTILGTIDLVIERCANNCWLKPRVSSRNPRASFTVIPQNSILVWSSNFIPF